MNFIVSASTDIGNVKDTNQDSFYAKKVSTPQGLMTFVVLCDGMGGLSKGEVASASVVHAFKQWSETKLPDLGSRQITDDEIRRDWVGLATACNEKIKDYGRRSGVNLGTTITAMLITQNRYFIINVGDTRAYEIAGAVKVLTNDQTLVAQEVSQGLLTPEQAERDPRRSVLLQCIGASEQVYPDMFFGDPIPGAVYMLCTDGFRHEITPDEIFAYLGPNVMLNAEGMKQNTDALIQLNKQRQERDNITCVTIRTF